MYKCIHASQCDNENIQSSDCIIDYNCYNNTQCIMHSSINQNTIPEPGLLFLSVLLFNWHPAGQIQLVIHFHKDLQWILLNLLCCLIQRAFCTKQATGSTAFDSRQLVDHKSSSGYVSTSFLNMNHHCFAAQT